MQDKKFPPEQDFTGGMIPDEVSPFIGSTGEKDLDDRILALARELSGVSDPLLLAEMMTTAIRIARGSVSLGDFKLMNRSLKEMRRAEEVFGPYRGCRKVALFGSARTSPELAEYQAAVKFARRMREEEFMTITGAGPGIMAAGNEGAGTEDSFGLNITLPFENIANEFIAGDPKLIDFNYFFTRKLSFIKEADALAAFPGGFGTMDEVFESLTLIQTGKASIFPVVLVDATGGTYWKAWNQFVTEHLHRNGMISDSDFSLFKVTDNVEEAVEEIVNFYSTFHSYRYVGDKMVLRLTNELTEQAVEKLNVDFADIVKSGKIVACDVLEEEMNEEELRALPRLCFRHRRSRFGRLRELIDAVNAAEQKSGDAVN